MALFSVHLAAWGQNCLNPNSNLGSKIYHFAKPVPAEKLMYSSYFGILF